MSKGVTIVLDEAQYLIDRDVKPPKDPKLVDAINTRIASEIRTGGWGKKLRDRVFRNHAANQRHLDHGSPFFRDLDISVALLALQEITA